MIRRLVERLADASDYARRAATYVEGVGLEDFAADIARREAVCFCLIVVGEACDHASKELTPLPLDISWSDIKEMRNILVHEYWQIADVIVARYEAAELADQLDNIRMKLDP